MNQTDPAAKRVLVLNLLRFSGVALALAGAAIVAGKIAAPVEAGYLLVVAGLIDALIVPPILARKWRTPL